MSLRMVVLMSTCLALAACQTTGETASSPTPTVSGPAPHAAVATVERSRQDANRDDVIQSLTQRKIRALDASAFRAVTVEVWNGTVLLMGAVIKPEQRRRAEQAAAGVQGVTKVRNELVLAEDRALDLFIPDQAMENKVRQTLGIAGKSGLTIRVLNNVAFLLGGVADKAQAQALKEDAGEVEGIKWVVAHLVSAP
ncbi:MAG: BON domain-containing protein [Magnetospirillum sp.]|nr:BON domain-containing protein [Magnetospirillum sp.]